MHPTKSNALLRLFPSIVEKLRDQLVEVEEIQGSPDSGKHDPPLGWGIINTTYTFIILVLVFTVF